MDARTHLEIVHAFRARRHHLLRGSFTILAGALYLGAYRIAWRTPEGAIWGRLHGRPEEALVMLNLLAEAYDQPAPYHVGSGFTFNNMEIATVDRQLLVAPLTAQLIEHEHTPRRTPMPHHNNHWQLYSTMHGWQDAAARLDAALAASLTKLDRMIATGTPASLAINALFNEMTVHMDHPDNAQFGACDSEPRDYLAQRLQRHLRLVHHKQYWVDRWGGVTEL